MVGCSFWLPVFARRSGARGPDAASGVSPEGETANTESGSGRAVDAARRPAMMAASYGRENRPAVGTMDGNEAGEDFIRSPSMCCWLESGRTACAALPGCGLKRNVGVCGFGLGGVIAAAEKADLTGDDFGAGAFAAAVFGFVFPRAQTAFDIHLPAFAQEPFARIGGVCEGHDTEQLGALLLRAVGIRETLRGGELKIRHVLTRRP